MLDANDQANLFRDIYSDLYYNGIDTNSRCFDCVEITDYKMAFPPYVRWINFTARNLKVSYFKREFLWYLHGDPYDLSICEHAKTWAKCIDDFKKINSNYGYYWFRKPPFAFNFVIQQLIHDEQSRRASMPIVSHEHLYIDNPDVPCTGYLNFRIRNNQLQCSVHMRSQDAIYGLGNDLPSFSILQEMILNMLLPVYPDLELGELIFHVDSFHYYIDKLPMIEKIIEHGSEFTALDCPRIHSHIEVKHLLAKPYRSILNGFPFTTWLTNRETEHAAK